MSLRSPLITLQNIQKIIATYNKAMFTYSQKNNVFMVRHGIIKYSVSITPKIKCNCDKQLCHHIIYILCEVYKIDINILYYFNKISDKISELISSRKISSLNTDLSNYIITSVLNDICGACLVELTLCNSHTLMQCHICFKYAHIACAAKHPTCIYCMNS
jgi:hypothetical protein